MILIERFLFAVDALVEAADIKHIVKHIVAGHHAAMAGYILLDAHAAQLHIIFKKIAAVEGRAAPDAQLFGDDIEGGRFPRPVAAIQDGKRLKIQPHKPGIDEGIKGVEAGVAGPLDRHAKIPLLILRGKNNAFQIQQSRATSLRDTPIW